MPSTTRHCNSTRRNMKAQTKSYFLGVEIRSCRNQCCRHNILRARLLSHWGTVCHASKHYLLFRLIYNYENRLGTDSETLMYSEVRQRIYRCIVQDRIPMAWHQQGILVNCESIRGPMSRSMSRWVEELTEMLRILINIICSNALSLNMRTYWVWIQVHYVCRRKKFNNNKSFD